MSDPLDPTDAIIGGVIDATKRLVSSLLFTAGAVVLGLNFHTAPKYLATIQANGLQAAPGLFGLWPPFDWAEMMLRSMVIWYLAPFLLVYGYFLFTQWAREELFGSLLGIVVVHSVHTFLYTQQMDPLTPGDLIFASSVLIVGETGLVGLLFWWRQMRLNASLIAPPE
jgi:hypothetical protein